VFFFRRSTLRLLFFFFSFVCRKMVRAGFWSLQFPPLAFIGSFKNSLLMIGYVFPVSLLNPSFSPRFYAATKPSIPDVSCGQGLFLLVTGTKLFCRLSSGAFFQGDQELDPNGGLP